MQVSEECSRIAGTILVSATSEDGTQSERGRDDGMEAASRTRLDSASRVSSGISQIGSMSTGDKTGKTVGARGTPMRKGGLKRPGTSLLKVEVEQDESVRPFQGVVSA